MSAFFPQSFYGTDPSFTPLFRLLDDFDMYSRQAQGTQDNGRHHGRHGRVRAFNPKFDVRETETAYELHGELPGIARDNVHIEFTEPQTLVIRGRVERTYTSGTPPAGVALEGGSRAAEITEAGEDGSAKNNGAHHDHSHRATVADEEAEEAKEQGTSGDVVAADNKGEAAAAPAPQEKFWVSERSIGEFSRTFSFPGRVDQDAVSANLQNGILHVVVPKAKKLESRRIAIN